MDSIIKICEKIGLQQEVIENVIVFDTTFAYDSVKTEMEQLLEYETADDARLRLKEVLGEDKNGIKILACMMRCLEKTYEQYKELGMPEQIFVDTMGCFPRFIEEHKVSYGMYGFDRDWWVARQIGMLLFRIGVLEYELTYEKGEKVVSIHIPSDAKLSIATCRESYVESQNFINKYYPEYKECNYICDSWLLSPALKELLPETSNIILFQDAFEIKEWDK
ncbi:acyltransferase domain-containing protein, partial [Anaerosporobacter sp.]|uniref:acyltransferase domain-containing protein n=1 Tax=Anaerosporobacter sp. TaxID=1872529 RepID=UPI00286EF502